MNLEQCCERRTSTSPRVESGEDVSDFGVHGTEELPIACATGLVKSKNTRSRKSFLFLKSLIFYR